MSPAPSIRTTRPAAPRRGEAGWVLAAALVLSTLSIAVTVTYARHAVLAKKSLEFSSGASEVEEASRSGMERVRERMRDGDLPGTVDEGTHDAADTPNGQHVTGERQVLPNQRREIRVRATGSGGSTGTDEYRTKARGRVAPGSGPAESRTTLECETGTMIAGHLLVISGPVQYVGVELAGLMLLEPGAELTLQDCVLRGTILTRHGVCKDEPPQSGANRPRVNVFGGLRLLAGTELPDTAMSAPDLVFDCDDASRVEVRGFACADEIKVKRGTMRGMVVSQADEDIDASKVRRPGHGRGEQSYPQCIEPGSERITRVVFPNDAIPASTLDAMSSCDID